MLNGVKNLLIWLPSPLGDAICATPALASIRQRFADCRITLLAAPFTEQILSPTPAADDWLTLQRPFWRLARHLRRQTFDAAILLKNSFGSALTVWLAGIPRRVGYARDGRSALLTDRIVPPKENGRLKVVASVDYYLNLAYTLGGQPCGKFPILTVEDADRHAAAQKVPQVFQTKNPLIILVPGGAFGPSKLWPPQRFAQCADALIDRWNAIVAISAAPTPDEQKIVQQIMSQACRPIIDLSQAKLTGGQLKAVFERAAVVVCNDTGPRHIAIGLNRKVVTMFGPNNPARTHTGYPREIQIIGKAPCVPCDKPVCKAAQHFCMESITVADVLAAVEQHLTKGAAP